MRLFMIFLYFLGIVNAGAADIEITSEDCNFEVRNERDAHVLRVSKIIAIADSVSRYEIELSKEKIKFPLSDGLQKKSVNVDGDESILTYERGILKHVNKTSANIDTLELGVSSDLKRIRHAKFTRKGTGILTLFGAEKFECKF